MIDERKEDVNKKLSTEEIGEMRRSTMVRNSVIKSQNEKAFRISMMDENKKNGDECEDMYMEMHHIVPKSWYRMKGEKINHGKGNVVYLSIRDYLRAFVLLSYYFASVGD